MQLRPVWLHTGVGLPPATEPTYGVWPLPAPQGPYDSGRKVALRWGHRRRVRSERGRIMVRGRLKVGG
ncbi:hypothetical protein [Streptomyces spinoverrucosus]|uniref:hypothetical protein n=1 Tax=Streptomyces spinoverrucosus TaxID=284043 RepID=UPI0011433380|nr:hypothetical protein [Streptomyces spinoverrucosus]